MNLEDLPRLESLSPIKDIVYHNLADQINLNRLEPQSSIAPMSSKNYLSKPYMLENNKSGNEPMLSGGLRYITQISGNFTKYVEFQKSFLNGKANHNKERRPQVIIEKLASGHTFPI
uniref:Uncharacterized protein n=1 Tax=Glossina palpalis gambiensis TaxID=67801 RepID=A0A1B0B1L4_9MUSC